MPTFTIYALGESEITVSGGAQLSGVTQGDATQLLGETITLESNAWEAIQIDDSEANFEDTDSSQTLDGAQSFDGVSYGAGLRVEAEYQVFVEDPDGNTYTLIGFNINEVGQSPAYGTVEGLAFVGAFPPIGVPLRVVSVSEGPAGSETPYDTYATPPCFLAGTEIATPAGPRAVEDLAPGDLVSTRDHGAREVVWVGRSRYTGRAGALPECVAPVRIRAGALGPGRPARDLWVSPQHRVLLTGWRAHLFFGASEVLVAAKHLLRPPGIDQPPVAEPLVYHHVLCAAHEILYAEGLETESFRPGPEVLDGLDPQDRETLLTLRPELARGFTEPPTRPLIGAREARVLQN